MFRTDLGSEAYQCIYDLLELDKEIMNNSSLDSSAPLTINRVAKARIDAILDIRELIDTEIRTWLKLVEDQKGGKEDAEKIDAMFDHILSERGTFESSTVNTRNSA